MRLLSSPGSHPCPGPGPVTLPHRARLQSSRGCHSEMSGQRPQAGPRRQPPAWGFQWSVTGTHAVSASDLPRFLRQDWSPSVLGVGVKADQPAFGPKQLP